MAILVWAGTSSATMMIDKLIAKALKTKQRQLLGDWNQMLQDARAGKVDTILITLPMRAEQRIREVLDKLSDTTFRFM